VARAGLLLGVVASLGIAVAVVMLRPKDARVEAASVVRSEPRSLNRPLATAKPKASAPANACRRVVSMRTPTRAAYGIVQAPLGVRTRPGGPVRARLGPTNQNGAPTVLAVLAAIRDRSCRVVWYRVQLPTKPNGSIGFVRPAQVKLGHVNTRIVVDLSDRRLHFFRKGRLVLTSSVAIGSALTPTPQGTYFVDQRLIPHVKTGLYGPAAMGIGAHSEVLTGWTQGGPIAIHGTNDPGSIGQAVSSGCVRLPNDILLKVFWASHPGTPVIIRQ
jgi:lipoprotein-anchoring transpeptidase ErfK/SrfK